MKLVSQHKNNSAISQISAYVTNFQGNKIIMSNHLMNYYFNKTIQDDIIYLDNKADPNIIEHYYSNYFRIFTTHRLSSEEYYLVNKLSFYHNPYVNKLWSHLTLYEYEKKE
tara:strand:- start:1174 stop:1506 length:333 start_codon:yes stop_codon:yes gene_type:complete